ncbi:uncharacterized protein LOC128739478 [Sabethes cyaneus]|uniref:uncharacterized protein LOC128739478 n=1 Tax=Sabethes cyaneus TaxID=53552 RepID=UPI00237E6F31|nr:uncharacterized protein LOC128739478 [Sabethes cyaneus]
MKPVWYFDYFDSVDTVKEAIDRAKQVRYIHQRGGFEIRNWVSNSPKVLQSLGEQKSALFVHFTQDKMTMKERVLGITWNQDEEIGSDCWDMWKRWTGLLSDVESVRIPRCYLGDSLSSIVESIELHVFTDASEHAYGCVAYLRVVVEGVVRCSLVMCRSKVAPLKRQSVPRLELMAAVLGARLSETILTTHTLKIDRIGGILELTRATDWRWISTKLNIADVLTKLSRNPILQSVSEWFTSPSFLHQSEDQWPSTDTQIGDTTEKARGLVLFHEVINDERCSRWITLLRGTAYALRFISNCIRKKNDELPVLTTNLTLKPEQQPERLARSSSIYKLTPVLVQDGILRMGGRMETSTGIPFDKRLPIIFPRKHGLTGKLIQVYHEKFGHANRETVVNELRQRFWIPSIRSNFPSNATVHLVQSASLSSSSSADESASDPAGNIIALAI